MRMSVRKWRNPGRESRCSGISVTVGLPHHTIHGNLWPNNEGTLHPSSVVCVQYGQMRNWYGVGPKVLGQLTDPNDL
jgi:hypothetical protein